MKLTDEMKQFICEEVARQPAEQGGTVTALDETDPTTSPPPTPPKKPGT